MVEQLAAGVPYARVNGDIGKQKRGTPPGRSRRWVVRIRPAKAGEYLAGVRHGGDATDIIPDHADRDGSGDHEKPREFTNGYRRRNAISHPDHRCGPRGHSVNDNNGFRPTLSKPPRGSRNGGPAANVSIL